MSKPKVDDVDSYIASSAEEARPKLEEIREIITSTVPGAEEGISWNVPYYRYHGELVGFDAAKSHVSFGFGAGVLESEDRKALEADGYVLGKETLRIRFDQETPTEAIKQILRTKAKLNEAGEA